MFSVFVFIIFFILRYFHQIYPGHILPTTGLWRGAVKQIFAKLPSPSLFYSLLWHSFLCSEYLQNISFLEYLLGLLVHHSLDIDSYVPNTFSPSNSSPFQTHANLAISSLFYSHSFHFFSNISLFLNIYFSSKAHHSFGFVFILSF